MPTRTAADRAERARALGPTDLVLSSLTVPRATVAERVAAAAEAGYAGIALHLANWKRLRREGWTIEAVADILDRHDQLLVEIAGAVMHYVSFNTIAHGMRLDAPLAHLTAPDFVPGGPLEHHVPGVKKSNK